MWYQSALHRITSSPPPHPTTTPHTQLVYTSPPDLYKRYLKPLLAERLYYLGVADGVAGQELRMRELVFDWLGACEPPIPREVALQVLGVERYVFWGVGVLGYICAMVFMWEKVVFALVSLAL